MENPVFRLRDFIRLLLSSIPSLIVLGLLLLLLTGMEQGLTIIVDLFDKPEFLILTILIINFLALIISHFPYYFELAIKDRDYIIPWQKRRFLAVLGFIYHNSADSDKIEEAKSEELNQVMQEHWFLGFSRRHLGVLTYGLFFYILIFVHSNIFEIHDNVQCAGFNGGDKAIIWFWNLVFIIIHLSLYTHFNKLNGRIKEYKPIQGDQSRPVQQELFELRDSVKFQLYLFSFLLLLNMVLVSILYLTSHKNGWSLANLNLLIWICSLNAITYMHFRLVRPWFVYMFGSDDEISGENDYPERILGEEFYVGSFIKPFRYLASSPNYLIAMGAFGMPVTLFTIVPGIFSDDYIKAIHPVPLMLILIIFYYSAFVILIKQFIYLRSRITKQSVESKLAFKIQAGGIVLGLSALLLSFFFVGHVNNDLHSLSLVEKQAASQLDDFIKSIDSSRHYFILGSYGGGLKANSWSQFILNEIHYRTPKVFNKTLCLSGVSGGAIGQANFAALKYHYPNYDYDFYDEKIVSVAESNMLSNDIFGWLFKDYWREWLPGEDRFQGRDRAYVSMRNYSQSASTRLSELEISLSDYWKHIRTTQYYPAIIFNTTPTSSWYGVACTLDDISFPNALDIADHLYIHDESDYVYYEKAKSYSLSFYGAASTSNRFPIFSPTARIPHKGHFVDGGYFENSGLMNAYAFYSKLKPSLDPDHELHSINIVNDKNLYILWKLRKNNIPIRNHPEPHVSELGSIVKGIVALERMPRYFRSVLDEDSIDRVNIFMPYIFSENDILQCLKADKLKAVPDAVIKNLVLQNKTDILNALEKYNSTSGSYKLQKWGLVTPPLGRLLSKPAVAYQKAMIYHHTEIQDVISVLDSLSRI